MIIHTLSHYLETHKRLVIPQLGTFVVKEPGQVLFTELLKRDDGVLRGVLCAEGMSEIEAAGEIDRFVYEVRHAMEHRAEYRMGGFGNFRHGPNGTIRFVYEPHPAEPTPQPDRVVPRHEQLAEAVRTAFSEMHLSSSVKRNPEPCLKGLRYGKPHKYANAYTYVGRSSRRGIDRFLLLAIAAAVIAVAAIAFGYYRKASDRKSEIPQTEQVPQTDSIQPQQSPKR